MVGASEYFKKLIFCYFVCMIPQPLSGFSFMAFIWSVLTGAPMSILFGYEMIYLLSPPRPNSFYDYASDSIAHDEYIKSSSAHPLEAPIYLSLAESLEENFGKMVKAGQLGLITDDAFFLMICDDWLAIVHIIAVEANKVMFQLRGLEYVEQTLCHGGELALLQQIVTEHGAICSFGNAMAFHFSMFELRALDWPVEMINISKHNFRDTIMPGLAGSALSWELQALVYAVLSTFVREGVEPPDGLVLDDVVPKFSEGHLMMIRFFATKAGLQTDEQLVKRIWNIVHFIHTVIVRPNGRFDEETIFQLFEGKVDLSQQLMLEKAAILNCFRFSVIVLLLVAGGLGPNESDHDELFRFMVDTEETYRALPLKSSEIAAMLRQGTTGIISMIAEEESVFLVRLATSQTKWAIFALESECIRGYWTNEAKSVLFFAISSRERNSIQMNVHSLRNITNQSCNQPIGYPAYVTDVIESINE
jgi:hypothetical protein